MLLRSFSVGEGERKFFMNPESFERKTYVPRDIEGEPLKQEFAEVRQIEARLDNVSEFVSIISEGSISKGYSVESSDIDLVLLYDSVGLKYNSEEYWNQRKEIFEIAQNAKEEIWEQRKAELQRPRNITFRLVDVNQDILENQFKHRRYDQLAYFFKLSTGKKIESYRTYWFKKINNLPQEKRTQLVEKLTDTLSSSDIDSDTLTGRVPGTEKEKLLVARKNLWKNRIENFLTKL